jgi:hypothetical protein
MGRLRLIGTIGVIAIAIGPTQATSLRAQNTIISREEFLATEWRLYGVVFAMHPPGGFPITFRPDGSLLTRNFLYTTTWSLSDGVLRLSGSNGEPYYRLDWVPYAGAFLDCRGPGMPSHVIYPTRSRGVRLLDVRCPNSPPLHAPRQETPVACRLDVVPDTARQGESVEFHYSITSSGAQRVSGRYFRLDEETFGHSLRLRSSTGQAYRFLRTNAFSYLLHLDADEGGVTPQTYRFAFPDPDRTDRARLVSADDWNRVWSPGDATMMKRRAAVFDAGETTVPVGSYEVSADLPAEIFRTRDRVGVRNAPISSWRGVTSVRCEPARLTVIP